MDPIVLSPNLVKERKKLRQAMIDAGGSIVWLKPVEGNKIELSLLVTMFLQSYPEIKWTEERGWIWDDDTSIEFNPFESFLKNALDQAIQYVVDPYPCAGEIPVKDRILWLDLVRKQTPSEFERTCRLAYQTLPSQEDKPADLYRYFDASDQLLYVGISKSAALRAFEHSGKTWWPLVVRSTIEHFSCRDDALAAEKIAIQTERPLFNIMHTPRHGGMQGGTNPSKPNADPVLSVRIPVELRDTLIHTAEGKGISPGEFVRNAIIKKLDLQEKDER